MIGVPHRSHPGDLARGLRVFRDRIDDWGRGVTADAYGVPRLRPGKQKGNA